jgi:hypothetical protein
MSRVAYILRQSITARRPTRWDVHARYALRLPDETLTLPSGTWLLALLAPADDNQPHPPHYRLADGRVVALDVPLTAEQADLLTDAQALTALTAYRPLEQAVLEDWGVWTEQVDHTPPFRLIQCPLCGGSDFTTVGFAEVWCDGCHAQFSVRHTAGDPGFVVDCTWRYYQYRAARYLVPRSDELLMTMVFKNSGDPLDLTHSRHCHRSDCTDKQVALTDGKGGPLRAGLHACALGDVYNWSFYGHAPTAYNHDRHGHHDLLWPDGRKETWPRTAFVPVTGFTWEERRQLEGAASLLVHRAPNGRYRDDLIAALEMLTERPSCAPYVLSRSPWPHRKHLKEGEKYLLHRWLLKKDKQDGLVTVTPVWLVVTDTAEDRYSHKWQVVRDNICIRCGEAVTVADMACSVNKKRSWETPHGHCREMWQAHSWAPTLFAPEEEAAHKTTQIKE